ncbi:MAG: hypothetical protein BGP11_08410 [Rhodobacterales bacterium 65-51]|uniref:hypothetical protein n=1 Tax=uncultured Gemmobacter sp. TaxID=1095917 RepID=UPI000967AA82|nr:hypothetical protein [uncultured Gemmobacter sp.]OJY36357.1 MAG: hypothetical protein BGP11_08410 [Rhodobacterales bacterium 65-51]
MTFVKLAGPAKIDGKWRKAGETVEVSPDRALDLDDHGLVADYPTDLIAAPGVDLRKVDLSSLPAGEKLITVTEEQFAQAVAAQAKSLAEAVSDAAVEAACAGIIADRDKAVEGVENLNRRVEALEAELEAERVSHDETRQQLAEATKAPDHTNIPPSEPPAETAPKKKGAAGTTKG